MVVNEWTKIQPSVVWKIGFYFQNVWTTSTNYVICFHYMFAKSWIFWFLLFNSSLMFLYPGVKVAFNLSNIYKFPFITGYLLHNARYFIGGNRIFGGRKVLANSAGRLHRDFHANSYIDPVWCDWGARRAGLRNPESAIKNPQPQSRIRNLHPESRIWCQKESNPESRTAGIRSQNP